MIILIRNNIIVNVFDEKENIEEIEKHKKENDIAIKTSSEIGVPVKIIGDHIAKEYEPTDPEKLEFVRWKRNKLLKDSDFLMFEDVTPGDKTDIKQYRQALRDFPENVDLGNIVWPVKPS
jgi:hypothetical protein